MERENENEIRIEKLKVKGSLITDKRIIIAQDQGIKMELFIIQNNPNTILSELNARDLFAHSCMKHLVICFVPSWQKVLLRKLDYQVLNFLR